MTTLYARYAESLAHLKTVARTAPEEEYLAAYTDCKALYLKVCRRERQRWYTCAVMRTILGKEYQRWQQERVRRDQRRYVKAMNKFFGIGLQGVN